MSQNYENVRPWGEYEVLIDENDYKVKRVIIKPKQRLSLQYHNHRSETWVVVRGKGIITRDELEYEAVVGTFVNIPQGYKHRIENTSDENLVFIEVQNGSYLEEDDIVRIQDDYNR